MRKNEIVAAHYISLSYQLLKKDFFFFKYEKNTSKRSKYNTKFLVLTMARVTINNKYIHFLMNMIARLPERFSYRKQELLLK